MDIGNWLIEATARLENAGIGTARLDALVLLEDATDRDRGWLLAHPEFSVRGPTLYKLEEWMRRREQHEPLAYIRGKTEFYGREFMLNKQVLEPRPESETMIDLLKKVYSRQCTVDNNPIIVDIGTGSGCLAVTSKLEFPKFEVVATDIDPSCLEVARQNAKKLGAQVQFLKGDLLQPLSTLGFQLLAVLANLPYVPDHYQINSAAMMEPHIAIFGGPDGLDLYRRLFGQIKKLASQPKYVLTESLPFQHKALAEIAKQADYKLRKTNDFIQVFKVA